MSIKFRIILLFLAALLVCVLWAGWIGASAKLFADGHVTRSPLSSIAQADRLRPAVEGVDVLVGIRSFLVIA